MATAAGWLDVDEWLDCQTREQWRERFAAWLIDRGWLKKETTAPRDDGFAALVAMATKGISASG